MRNGLDPIFIIPRMLPRAWGRADIGDWCASAPRPDAPIGEICALHAYNVTESGDHLGKLIADATADMLGDLGRAPPALRLVLTDAHTGLMSHSAPALWRVLEAEAASTIDILSTAENDRRSSTKQCKSGDTYRVGAEGAIGFSGGVVAVEARANFRPRNADTPIPTVARLAARTRADDKRIALLREPSLSVEVWTLPARSRLTPDGETCHALMALSPGIAVDGRPLAKGEVVFVPAYGRNLSSRGPTPRRSLSTPTASRLRSGSVGRPPILARWRCAIAIPRTSRPHWPMQQSMLAIPGLPHRPVWLREALSPPSAVMSEGADHEGAGFRTAIAIKCRLRPADRFAASSEAAGARARLLFVGRQSEDGERAYLHRGIPPRASHVQFDLADFVRVNGAAYELGLLVIELQRELPKS